MSQVSAGRSNGPVQGSPPYHYCVAGAQRRPLPEDIEIGGFQSIEDANAAQPCCAQLVAQPPPQNVAHIAALFEEVARPLRGLRQGVSPGWRQFAAIEMRGLG